jgi:hypothetical protein
MTEGINGLIWILERLHVTPSTTALWVLFSLGLLSLVIAPTASYMVKRLRLARAKKGNIVPAIGMIVTAAAFVVFLIWDVIANGSVMKAEKAAQAANVPAGAGGSAGSARVEYGEGDAKGGKGGKGGALWGGPGGKGGDATVIGGKGSALAGDGGDAGQNPGDGGQGGASAWPKMVAADPLLQRVDLAQRLTDEYKAQFGAADPTGSGSEAWINSRLRELGQKWYVENTSSGFKIIDAPKAP